MSQIINIPEDSITLDATKTAQENIAKALANQAFFDHVRGKLFNGSLSQDQVDGLNIIVRECVAQSMTLQQMSYVLATAYHETAHTMQPISEYGRGEKYDYGRWRTNSNGVRYCYKNSDRDTVYTEQECPHLFFGRGYVQLTWHSNYQKAGEKLGIDLLANPNLAKQADAAAKILCMGMKEGWFTGRKLSRYVNDNACDYVEARKVVNGEDKETLIARHARVFETALNAV